MIPIDGDGDDYDDNNGHGDKRCPVERVAAEEVVNGDNIIIK